MHLCADCGNGIMPWGQDEKQSLCKACEERMRQAGRKWDEQKKEETDAMPRL